MMILCSNNNYNKMKVNDLSQMQINKLTKLLQKDWRDVIKTLPSIQNE